MSAKTYLNLFVDARYEKVRVGHWVVSQRVLIVSAVREDGFREILTVDVADTESEATYQELFRSLKARGLKGAELVTSDDYPGLKVAIARYFQGASWQRWQVHYARNLTKLVPCAKRKELAAGLRGVFAAPTRNRPLPSAPYDNDDWPTTTLPAFEAAWCAAPQGEAQSYDYYLRVRRAFFAESRNIGRREVLLEIAEEAGLDMRRFERDFSGEEARRAVLEECRIGRERHRVRGTATVMLPDGRKLRHPIAFPQMKGHKVVGVLPLPCCGEWCLEETRESTMTISARRSSQATLRPSKRET